MVNPVGSSGYQSYATSQPGFAAATETKANTEQVQPRQAPAADSQRADARQSRQERNDEVEFRDRPKASEQSARAPTNDDGRRGSLLDVNA